MGKCWKAFVSQFIYDFRRKRLEIIFLSYKYSITMLTWQLQSTNKIFYRYEIISKICYLNELIIWCSPPIPRCNVGDLTKKSQLTDKLRKYSTITKGSRNRGGERMGDGGVLHTRRKNNIRSVVYTPNNNKF
jgi:hypothetical protein